MLRAEVVGNSPFDGQAQDVVKEVWAFMESMGFRNPEVKACDAFSVAARSPY